MNAPVPIDLIYIEPLLICDCIECKTKRWIEEEHKQNMENGPTIEQIRIVERLPYVKERRLPNGAAVRHYTSEEIQAVQRRRLITALAESIRKKGYRKTIVQDVVELSGVSRRAFYEFFDNKYNCFMSALAYARETI